MSRFWRQLTLLLIDVIAGVVAVIAAFYIRFAFDGRPVPYDAFWLFVRALPIIIPLRMIIYHLFGLYRQMWTYASVPELLRILYATLVDTLLSSTIIFALPHAGFPRSIFIIGWFLKAGSMGAIRLALRLRREWYTSRSHKRETVNRTLIFGAGDAGALLAKEFTKHPELGGTVVGFIDDDLQKVGYHIGGKPVLGTRADLAPIVLTQQITHVVIAMPSAKGSVVREVVEEGRKLGLQLKTLPGLFELVNGTISVSQIRDVQIEDLLGREEVKVDLEAIAAYVSDEVVLVTGAGGSIGSELCRQVARFKPGQLLLLGHGENSIYEIDLELRQKYPSLDIRPIIADIQDEERIRRVFDALRPGVVFHAAAHKHVPLMEYNPEEAIKNNVFGTLNVARAADRYKAKRFVLISSDKAVNPTSVMGATKRAAEYVVQSLARTSSTIFVAVRFGNVLGSRGSVVPLFKKQIARGGPVTITDPRMVRYFMTIPEAAQLVIQAASMGNGGEIFVLDMGRPVRILDLARDLIRLSGFEPEADIKIEYQGIRTGEKLYEELLTAEEGTVASMHEKIHIARGNAIPWSDLIQLLEMLRGLSAEGQADNETIRRLISGIVDTARVTNAVEVGD